MTWYHRVHTEWQWPRFGVHSIMMEKSPQPGENGGCTPAPFRYIYHLVQSCGVRSSWEGRFTPPSSTLPQYLLCDWYSLATCDPQHPLYLRSCILQKKQKWRDQGESHRDVVYLGWSKAPSYMSPNAGLGGWEELRGLSQWAQLCTWSPKLWRSTVTPYLTNGKFQAKYALLFDNETHHPSSFHVGLLRRGNSL
jgi:hypothetical protein